MNWIVLGVCGYVGLQLAVGLIVSRRIRSESDYLLAGRSLGYGLAIFTLFATWFGAETCIGASGATYSEGLRGGRADPFGYTVCLALMGLLFAGPLRRSGALTLGDVFQSRFSPLAEKLVVVFLVPGSVLWGAAQIRALGQVLSVTTQLDFGLTVAIATAVVILYTGTGGMRADVMTDLVQGIALILGLGVLLVAVVAQVGGAGPAIEMARASAAGAGTPDASPWLSWEAWLVPIVGSITAQELAARALACRTPVIARNASLVAAGLYLVVGLVPVALGLIGSRLVPGLPDPERLIPTLAGQHLNGVLYVILVGALISAILSTVDSNLLSASALISHNVVLRLWTGADERSKVRISRILVVVVGLVSLRSRRFCSPFSFRGPSMATSSIVPAGRVLVGLAAIVFSIVRPVSGLGQVETPPPPGPVAPASTDTVPVARSVVRLAEFLVRGSRLHDALSSQTVRNVRLDVVRALPVDRLTELIALQAGVVGRGDDLHVRGGRAGETRVFLQGISLGEPTRGKPLEMPLLALREAELASGGFDADLGGALAGVIQLRTVEPGERWEAEGQWQTDARLDTHFDQVSGRVSGRLPRTPVGLTATVEARLDDTHLPALRTASRREILGGSFGWRADNRLLGHLKLSAPGTGSRWTLEWLANRHVDRPFNPMWSLDGWTTTCFDTTLDCAIGPAYSAVPRNDRHFVRYVAPDHAALTDDRKSLATISWARLAPQASLRLTCGWLRFRSITSLDGTDDERYLAENRAPVFGFYESRFSDPFFVYAGDEPYFKKVWGDALTARADWQRTRPRGDLFKAGLGATYEAVGLREVDLSVLRLGVDSVRAYRAFAPGAFAYGHARLVYEGLVANAGLRLEGFTAGAQAERQTLAQPAHWWWSLSPRAGVAYPISTRNVISLSYVRVSQNPDRDFLYDNRREISNRQPLGNPALEPASLISYQAALKHLLGSEWSIQAGYFYRDLFGLVGSRNVRPPNVDALLTYQNADDAHASGFELSLFHDHGGRHAQLNYTYLEALGSQSREEGIPFGPRLEARPESVGEHPLDWDRRHSVTLSLWLERPDLGSISWTSFVGTGLPWSPRPRREEVADLSLENSRRFPWHESTSLSVRWRLPWRLRPVTLGVDVRNLFDGRWDETATLAGYPHPDINTFYDDYGAYRTETGRGGGAYYDDLTGDGLPGWVPVNDPRLLGAPRSLRARVGVTW